MTYLYQLSWISKDFFVVPLLLRPTFLWWPILATNILDVFLIIWNKATYYIKALHLKRYYIKYINLNFSNTSYTLWRIWCLSFYDTMYNILVSKLVNGLCIIWLKSFHDFCVVRFHSHAFFHCWLCMIYMTHSHMQSKDWYIHYVSYLILHDLHD